MIASGNGTVRQEFERLVYSFGALPAGSPATDAADATQSPADDILGRSRGATPDLGAFEAPACTLDGDVDRDGDADAADVMAVARLWRRPGVWPFDRDDSAEVTVLDVMDVAAHWGAECSSGGYALWWNSTAFTSPLQRDCLSLTILCYTVAETDRSISVDVMRAHDYHRQGRAALAATVSRFDQETPDAKP